MQWNFYFPATAASLFLLFSPCSHADSAKSADPVAPRAKLADCQGLWVWQEEYIEDDASRTELFSFCQQQKINRLLVQIHFAEDGTVASPDALKTFLAKARAAGIAVEALDGAPGMGLESNRAETLRHLDAVLAFQKAQPAGQGFSGVHYDIEPYLSPRWRGGDEQGVALETLAAMQAIRDRVTKADPAMTVAYDIPSWYSRKPALGGLKFQGRTENFQRHIQDLSDYVGIMSYRRRATGPNSIVDISTDVLDYAAKTGKKACPSFETNLLKDDPEISFFNTSPDTLTQAINETRKACGDSAGFGGILIHDYRGLHRLVDAPVASSAAKPSASN